MSVYVLYAKERLGVGDLGFGLLLAASAVGGAVGAACYGALSLRFTLATLMRAGLSSRPAPTSRWRCCARRSSSPR